MKWIVIWIIATEIAVPCDNRVNEYGVYPEINQFVDCYVTERDTFYEVFPDAASADLFIEGMKKYSAIEKYGKVKLKGVFEPECDHCPEKK